MGSARRCHRFVIVILIFMHLQSGTNTVVERELSMSPNACRVLGVCSSCCSWRW